MELSLSTLWWVTAGASGVAAFLGYVSERSLLGVVMLGGSTLVACTLCLAGYQIGSWWGLGVAFLLDTFLAYRAGKWLGKERGAIFVPGLWWLFALSCAVGYWAGGELGLLTITIPSLVAFWGALAFMSRSLLPTRDRRVFRCLFSHSLGTNYPYQVLVGRELQVRVPGNPFGQFFAGDGIVVTGPQHAPVIGDGLAFRRVADPGLSFTGRFETVQQVVDLRPQLRSFRVEAITQDGIRVHVLTFVPFQLYAGGQQPNIGTSFPFDEDAIYKAVWQQPVEQDERRPWDEVVPMVATRLLRNIISGYRCDELCEPFHPGRDPREKIKTKLIRQLRREMAQWGIEILGGGLSNFEPADAQVMRERVEAWKAEWDRKIMDQLGEGQAKALFEVERAHVQAQARMIATIGNVVSQHRGMDAETVANIACLRLIESLEEMAENPQVREAVPPEAMEVLPYLRSISP